MSQATLARLASFRLAGVRRAIQALVECGYVRLLQRGAPGHASRYQVLDGPLALDAVHDCLGKGIPPSGGVWVEPRKRARGKKK